MLLQINTSHSKIAWGKAFGDFQELAYWWGKIWQIPLQL